MESALLQHRVVGTFTCLGAECPDTCCAGWDMPVDQQQLDRYREQAPELLATVDLTQGIMKKDAPCGNCTQLSDGMCGIQNARGSDFLGDSCHFYPRIVHRIGERKLMSGSTSCPQMLRLILTEREPFVRENVTLARMPGIRRDILPEDMRLADLLATMDGYLSLTQAEMKSPEQVMLSITDKACDGINAGTAKAQSPHLVYYALALTEAFSDAPRRPALDVVMQQMEAQLGCNFVRAERTITLAPDAMQKLAQLNARWQADARGALAPVLRRWIAAQLAMTSFPFGGLPGLNIFERITLLVQRYVTMRLALMCHVGQNGVPPDEATTIRVIQVLSRFMDHLADAKLTQMIFRDLGWSTPNQLRALIG